MKVHMALSGRDIDPVKMSLRAAMKITSVKPDHFVMLFSPGSGEEVPSFKTSAEEMAVYARDRFNDLYGEKCDEELDFSKQSQSIGDHVTAVKVDSFDANEVKKSIVRVCSTFPSNTRYTIDVTKGTGIMKVGACLAAIKIGMQIVHIKDSRYHHFNSDDEYWEVLENVPRHNSDNLKPFSLKVLAGVQNYSQNGYTTISNLAKKMCEEDSKISYQIRKVLEPKGYVEPWNGERDKEKLMDKEKPFSISDIGMMALRDRASDVKQLMKTNEDEKYYLITSQERILRSIAGHPEGVDRWGISLDTRIATTNLSNPISVLKNRGFIVEKEKIIYITKEGKEALKRRDGVLPTKAPDVDSNGKTAMADNDSN